MVLNVRILGTGTYLPRRTVPSTEIDTRLGQHPAIVELQRRDARQRAFDAEGLGLVLLRVEVHVHQRNARGHQVDTFFGQEHPHATRVGCARCDVELHALAAFSRALGLAVVPMRTVA